MLMIIDKMDKAIENRIQRDEEYINEKLTDLQEKQLETEISKVQMKLLKMNLMIRCLKILDLMMLSIRT